jgi:hypothetical protein
METPRLCPGEERLWARPWEKWVSAIKPETSVRKQMLKWWSTSFISV